MAGRRRLMFAKDFTVDYLKFTALENGTFTLTINSAVTTSNFEYVEYSVDEGVTWVKTNNVASTMVTVTTPTVSTGDSVLWRGKGLRTSQATSTLASRSTFSSTGRCNVSGNINTLLKLDKPQEQTGYLNSYAYRGLFYQMTTLVDASELSLPKAGSNAYNRMFYGCTALTSPPTLFDEMGTSSTSNSYCCSYMFYGCSSLTSAPALTSTILSTYCYEYMFSGCTSLTVAPVLPAQTLASSCYRYMFQNCTFTTPPALPATSLNESCYYAMFRYCSSLTTAPLLPANTLASSCYRNMFQGCTSLTTAPVLPASELVNYCYTNTFDGCTQLNYIKAYFLAMPTSSVPTSYWMNNVAATGIFVKHIDATWEDVSINGVPENWTIIYYDPDDEKYYTDQQKTTECDDHGNPI